MWEHQTQIRVRYGETDKMGYLYYGHYAEYFEVARVEMIRSIGLSYREIEDKHRLIMPVISMEIQYKRPAYYDDLLTIHTKLLEWPEKEFKYHFDVFNDNEKLLTIAKVNLCFVETQNGKRIDTPQFILDKITDFFSIE